MAANVEQYPHNAQLYTKLVQFHQKNEQNFYYLLWDTP